MMIIDNKFDLEQLVFLKTDPDQCIWIVTQIGIMPANVLVYRLTSGSEVVDAYEFEIADKENVLIKK